MRRIEKDIRKLLIRGKIENNEDYELFKKYCENNSENGLIIRLTDTGYAKIEKDNTNQEILFFENGEDASQYDFFYEYTIPKLTDKQKESIDIVVDLLERRIKWLEENAEYADFEIQCNKDAIAIVTDLIENELYGIPFIKE